MVTVFQQAGTKKPAQRSLKQVALPLAEFIKRPQSESNRRLVELWQV